MKPEQIVIKSLLALLISWNSVATIASEDKISHWEKFLKNWIISVKACADVDMRKLSDICRDMSSYDKRDEVLSLFREFEDEIFSIDLSRMGYLDQAWCVDVVWDSAWRLWGAIPVSTDKERWEIRLKALEWKKKQLDRLMASSSEDNRSWPEKWRNPRAPRDSEKGQWDEAVLRMKSRFYKSDLRICVQAAEDDRYSDEFRAWCFKEIEKIIGRPLTDDDIMFKDEVLRRRAKRLIDRIPNAWNESVVSFTNIAYKASAAINRIAGQKNRLKCAEAYSNQIKDCLRKLDKRDSKSISKEGCVKPSPEQKAAIMKTVIEITGETPEWYKKELDEEQMNISR